MKYMHVLPQHIGLSYHACGDRLSRGQVRQWHGDFLPETYDSGLVYVPDWLDTRKYQVLSSR
jgi:hypothetical protein